MDLRAGATRVATLAIVQFDVDELIDNILDLFPFREIRFEFPEAFIDARRDDGCHLYLLKYYRHEQQMLESL